MMALRNRLKWVGATTLCPFQTFTYLYIYKCTHIASKFVKALDFGPTQDVPWWVPPSSSQSELKEPWAAMPFSHRTHIIFLLLNTVKSGSSLTRECGFCFLDHSLISIY